MANVRYINKLGQLTICSSTNDPAVACVSEEDREKVCSVVSMPCSGTSRWSYRGLWGSGWGIQDRASYSYLYQTYNIPPELWCNYHRPCKGVVNAINYFCGNSSWSWGWNFWGYYGWSSFLSCGVSNSIFTFSGTSPPSFMYQSLNTVLCAEVGEEDCAYPRLKNCLRPYCVSPSISNACDDIIGKDFQQGCCKSGGCGTEEECKITASTITQTYSIDYEIVKPAYSCVEDFPVLPETSAVGNFTVYSDTCRSCTYGCSPDITCRAEWDTTECYCCDAETPNEDAEWTEIVRWDTEKTIRYEVKDCAATTCSVCADCEGSCLRNSNQYYGYNYINRAHSYIGSDCCNTGWSSSNNGYWSWNYGYGSGHTDWWRIQNSGFVYWSVPVCPDNSIGPNQNYYCPGSSCSVLDRDNDIVKNLSAYSSKASCERYCGNFDAWLDGSSQCFSTKPAYVTGLACSKSFREQYQNNPCYEQGPGYKTEEVIVVNPPDPKCFAPAGGSVQEYRFYTDYISFKPKYRKAELVEAISYWKAWETSIDTSYPQAWRCASHLPCGAAGFAACMENVVSACQYPEPLGNSLITYSIAYNPPEILSSVTAELTVYFCKLLYGECNSVSEE